MQGYTRTISNLFITLLMAEEATGYVPTRNKEKQSLRISNLHQLSNKAIHFQNALQN